MALDYQQVAILLSWFLPRGKVSLCIDRTEWDFGKCQVNILMITARRGEVCVPLYWELLDNKSGNSSSEDRIDLLEKCINLLGARRIGLVIGDREFVGHRWLKYLKVQSIGFCIRLPRHHLVERHDGQEQSALEILGETGQVSLSGVLVDGVWANVWLKKLVDGDLLYLFGTPQAKFLGQLYRKRWTIECFFQALKSRGFDLESTHLKDLEKLKKLVALVSIAFAFCSNLGLHHHLKIKPIPLKKHGYKAKSFFRKGLDIVRQALKRQWKDDIQLFKHLLCRFLRWLSFQQVCIASG